MLIALLFFLVMSPGRAVRPQPPQSRATAAAKATKVWTNDTLKTLKGGVSVVGKSAPSSDRGHSGLSYGEETDDISITSPPNGTTVYPGEAISVEVEVTSGAKLLSGIALVSPMGIQSQIKQSPPYTFDVQIPASDGPGSGGSLIGEQPIFAVAAASGRSLVRSSPLMVDVEQAGFPVSLGPQIPSLSFKAPGESFPLIMLGKFPDGTIFEVNNSTYFSFSSSDPAIATVDKYGVVTASGPGSTSIVTAYRKEGKTIAANIPVYFEHPVMEVEPGSIIFGAQPLGGSSGPHDLIVTNNSNSAMTILEVQIAPGFSETDDCRNAALPTHSHCTFHVTFTPARRGQAHGTLTIYNGTSSIPAQISLSGIGQ